MGDKSEHKNFLLYHNGIAIICSDVVLDKGNVTISGYSVINGCQSLSSLFDNQGKLSSDLRILTKIIQIPDDPSLVDKITHNSNNQNGIKARDFKSNNPLQVRLQQEFAEKYGGQIFYRISRGEQSSDPVVIDNELAARILLAFDNREPWSSHQAYKLFDELYQRIFSRPEVDAERIVALYHVYTAIVEESGKLADQRFAQYTLTRFFLLYLVAEALSTDPVGTEFIKHPGSFISQPNGEERLRTAIGNVLKDLIVDLNAEIDAREKNGNPVDFKRDLKSPSAVRTLAKDVIASYQKLVQRGRSPSFGQDWESSTPEAEAILG